MLSWQELKLLLVGGLLITLVVILAQMKVQQKIPSWIKRPLSLSKYKALTPYVYAQVMLETGGLTSKIYEKANNAIGFKTYGGAKSNYPSERDGGYYAEFASPEESIYHLIVWFDRKQFPRSVKSAREYAEELKKRGYYQASVDVYTRNLEFWLNSLK
jgi:hypothetical protein